MSATLRHSAFPSSVSRSVEEVWHMSKGTYPLKLPQSIKRAAERLAKQDGVSLNQ
jgi:hypothetical protein